MAWAQEMGALVADIHTSHRDRTKFVRDNANYTHDLIARFQRELKAMASALEEFLAKSEADRKKDFASMINEIRARVKDIKGDTQDLLFRFGKEMKELQAYLKEFLADSEAMRMKEFNAMMNDITSDIEAIVKHTAGLLRDDASERKEAHAAWAGVSRGGAAEEHIAASPTKKRGRPKKQR